MPPDVLSLDDRLHAVLRIVVPRDVLNAIAGRAPSESLWFAACRALECDDTALSARIARHFGIGVAVVGTLDPALRRFVPEPLARRLGVLPLRASETVLTLATAVPGDVDAERAIAAGSGRRVRLAVAPPSVVAAGIDVLYRDAAHDSGVDRAHPGVPSHAQRPAPAPRDESRTTVALVDEIIARGIDAGASDLHLECNDGGVAVRVRVDGVLRDAGTFARDAGAAVVSRIKIMAGLDIADRMRPQDGRAQVVVAGRALDLRVSTLPASHGEKVVIRVLDPRAAQRDLDALGLASADAARLHAMLDAREGLVLVTGPTGSGKTTTLYASLRYIQRRGVNVVTVEDPVEYRLPGIAQVQVNERAGLSFAAALRSTLRQDPDVILVGEIRDAETAGIAAQAALTGHLVLSTLHTIDAPSAVTRLADLGVEPFKLAATLRGVVAQRLLRRRCDRCDPSAACAHCGGSGYRGRVAAVELLSCGAEVARRIARGDAARSVRDAAASGGMRSLWACGLDHAARGVTDLAEVRRCLDAPAESQTRAVPDLDACFDLV